MNTRVRELSPRGPGALSVVRIAGPRAFAALRGLAPGSRLRPGSIELVRLTVDGEDLDEALVCTPEPEVVEVHVHGSPHLVARLITSLEGALGSQADPTPLAVALEERAWRRLADAPSEAGARILLDQAEGALRREVEAWGACASAERAGRIDRLLSRARIARFALEPARVVLAGPVNAGKSTLFNALVGERRALVSEVAGTTRDLVIERARFGAWPVLLTDSAGERALDERKPALDEKGPALDESEPALALERAGQRRARRARADADLVLWLEPLDAATSGGRAFSTDCEGARCVRLATCADRLGRAARRARPDAISALHEPENARAVVLDLFQCALELPSCPWSPGEPLPFEAGQIRDLEALRRTGSSQEFGSLVRSMLEPR